MGAGCVRQGVLYRPLWAAGDVPGAPWGLCHQCLMMVAGMIDELGAVP